MSRALYGARAGAVAFDDGERAWTFGDVAVEAEALAARLQAKQVRVLATLLDNSPAWAVADLAAAQAGAVHVPLPAFFTSQQRDHALRAAGVDAVLVDPPLAAAVAARAAREPLAVAGRALELLRLSQGPVALPAGTAKITFTSGTTGWPKGVCLGAQAMDRVAAGIAHATDGLRITRHLCALPLAVLLENIAGLMAPRLRAATCIVPPLQTLGLGGSSSFEAAVFHAAVERHRPNSVIVLPQMLRAWAGLLAATGRRVPDSLRFVAVGGAAVGAKLITDARALGIPAYEGYGLSEGGSVQTLNLPGADRPGTAGRPLPHARVRVAGDGEIEVAGTLFLGDLAAKAPPPTWWPTGDLGCIDADGFVHVHGRKKNVLITAFGRNVSPEWVETVLQAQRVIAHAVVLGEAQPSLGAVLWPASADADDAALDAAVAAANAALPDYARITRWTRAAAAFSPHSGLATPNGRPQRGAIEALHAAALGFDRSSLSSSRIPA